MFNRLTDNHLSALERILGQKFVSWDTEIVTTYSHDWTEDYRFPPEVVVFPETPEQIAAILQLASTERIPVTPVGARTGLSGGMLPVFGGIAVATSRMNRILGIDLKNLQVTVEPGVITQHLQDAVEAHGLYYPPDPSSKGSCFIGGNIAESAGGIHAVKYGITKDYVLNLEVVLPTGQILWTGANVLKNSTGYHLTQLMIGSEGTLGIITKAVLKLIPKPKFRLVLSVPFADAELACEAVSAVFRAGITPSALEFIEKDAIDFGQAYLNHYLFDTSNIEAQLLIELDGNYPEILWQEAEQISQVMEQFEAGEILVADSAEQQTEIWRLRRCLGEAVKGNTIYKEEDAVVPRAELAKVLRYVKQIGREYGFQSVCYGHAGDGNLHINIIKNNLTQEQWENQIPEAIQKIFQYIVSLKGTISGEHGIGWVQKRFLPIAFPPHQIELLKQIKKVFDPAGILNPGKIFPELPSN
ncbi:MAG: FAD-binding protein [Bacteroidia bacterium]|nr:FAD-binding protein [Bacteroidia bacterium]